MLCGWEGNRRPGVALAIRHRLSWLIHLRAHGQRKVDYLGANTLDSTGKAAAASAGTSSAGCGAVGFIAC